ncbi:protein CASP [Elysia marginata]|uniref:Protein CASP n=1 Tax=Elysia marginata TaxID=1093978 RepID=A0AAV4FJ07_9GAST|nr:protein CASP [Elysia marginata]
MILGNRCIKQKDIAKELEIAKERVQHIITDVLGCRKVSARWVARMLTDEMKMQRKTTCAELLKHYEEEGEEFIQRIVTGDETWVHHYDPESNYQSMEYRHKSSLSPRKFKVVASARKQVHKLQEDYREAVTTLHDQKSLITQLEEDLRNVNALSSMFRGDAEGEPGPGDANSEAMASIVKEMAPVSPTLPVTGDPSSKSAADSLLPIVQSQRERYRLRAQELEAQTLSQQQQVTVLQNEMDKLRSDNVKLYEKIRFLQSYPVKGGATDDVTNSYSSQYEERLDPFTSFSRKERQRRYLELKPYDKITLSMGRLIMGNKTARAFAFFYTLILHLLVFLVLYKLAHTESCKRDMMADWHERYAEHMMKVHGAKDPTE